jgi:lincosamide nucleotidyltransferase B/F
VKPDAYVRFTEELADRTARDPSALALVAVGSMAHRDRAPDEFSDHDFFLVVRSGEQERFRSDLAWLPGAERIALTYRETAHGVKVVYDDGHLLEFAVFDPEELSLARVNSYRVLWDRGAVEERVSRVAAATRDSPEARVPADDWLAGQFLTNLLVGVDRYRRGERISGRELVKGSALRHLLRLLEKHVRSDAPERLDELDPLRRFESAFPGLGAELNALLERDTPAAARRLLDVAMRELPGRIATRAARAVAARLEGSPSQRDLPPQT